MLKNVLFNMHGLESRLQLVAPKGYMLALNIRFLTPEYLLSTYPSDWVTIYTQRRYVLFDPIAVWARFSEGRVRWSEISGGFFQGAGNHVIEHASKFGLNYGACVSSKGVDDKGSLSVLVGAREDREMTDDELQALENILDEILSSVGSHAGLTEAELEVLRHLAEGLTHNEIGASLGVSAATVKKRIERARSALGARSAVHAVAIATRRGLIFTDPIF